MSPHLFAIVVLGSLATAANAQFMFIKVADTQTLVPGGTGTYLSGFTALGVTNGRVVFHGGDGVTAGVYSWEGGVITVVADNHTPVPGGGGIFSSLFAPTYTHASGANTLIRGGGGSAFGHYIKDPAGFTIVANNQTMLPGGGLLTGLPPGGASIDGTDVAFVANTTTGLRGVFTKTAQGLTKLVDTQTLIPNSALFFSGFGRPWINYEDVTFYGATSGWGGLYRAPATGGPLEVIADLATPHPVGGTFSTFSSTRIDTDGEDTVFWARQSTTGLEGIFRAGHLGFETIVMPGLAAPGGGIFESFGPLATSNGMVVFEGKIENVFERSLYLSDAQGVLHKIISPGQMLEGKTIMFLSFETGAMDGNQVAIRVRFTDDIPPNYSGAVYMINIPGPGGAMLLGGAAVFAMRRAR